MSSGISSALGLPDVMRLISPTPIAGEEPEEAPSLSANEKEEEKPAI